MRTERWLFAVALVGCGRLGFDDRASTDPGQPASATFSPIDEAPDASMFAAPSTVGLVAYWPFDEADAAEAADVTGDGMLAECRSGSNTGGGTCPGRTTGIIGNAALFSPDKNTCFTVPSMQTWAASAFTVGAWVNTPISGGSVFVHESENGCPSPELGLGSGMAGLVQLNTSDSTHNNAFTPAMTVAANQWHHVAVTWDGTAQQVFVDGACDCSITPPMKPLDNPEELTIGCYPDNSEVYTGEIDDLRVYDRVLAADEIGALYSYGSHVAPASHGCQTTCANVAPPL
jgi:hypothetical protein